MELLGSNGSPYVRRIRLSLAGQEHDYREMDIYGADREALRAHSPVLKIPTLLDGEHTLFESRVIQRYLADKFGWPALTWAEENAVSVADGANDAGVVLRLSQRSGLDTTRDDVMYHTLQHDRLRECIDWLAEQAAAGVFDDWRFPAICVYCAVDWLAARELFDFSGHPALQDLLRQHADRPQVAATDPRTG